MDVGVFLPFLKLESYSWLLYLLSYSFVLKLFHLILKVVSMYNFSIVLGFISNAWMHFQLSQAIVKIDNTRELNSRSSEFLFNSWECHIFEHVLKAFAARPMRGEFLFVTSPSCASFSEVSKSFNVASLRHVVLGLDCSSLVGEIHYFRFRQFDV